MDMQNKAISYTFLMNMIKSKRILAIFGKNLRYLKVLKFGVLLHKFLNPEYPRANFKIDMLYPHQTRIGHFTPLCAVLVIN